MTQVVQDGGLSNPHHRWVFCPISPDNAQPVGMPPAPPSATASGGPQDVLDNLLAGFLTDIERPDRQDAATHREAILEGPEHRA
jgi:hypothetical protein